MLKIAPGLVPQRHEAPVGVPKALLAPDGAL
jgi:hypothetical protein